MIIVPKVRGFICTTAHPKGCEKNVKNQIEYIKQQLKTSSSSNGPKKVLVIGASTGYGLASRITAAFGYNAQTIGVFFEKEPSGKRTGSAGWYNTAALENEANAANIYCKSINGDAFSKEIKQKTLDLIKKDWGTNSVDLVIYSLASPRRIDPKTGQTYNSVLKPVGDTYKNKTVNILTGDIFNVEIEPAKEEEVEHTVKVMGGEDWTLWIDELINENLLAKGALTLAYSYIGPKMTYPIYRNGTIGKAKEHLEKTAHELTKKLEKSSCNGKAFISVNKALVTQASSAIPVVPLYISLLYKIMKEKNIHEGCIEQMWRMFNERLYLADANANIPVDESGKIRIDDYELREDVQLEIVNLWKKVETSNIETLSDINGYREEFYKLFGFHVNSVDYSSEVDHLVKIASF